MTHSRRRTTFGLPSWWFVSLGIWGITGAPLWAFSLVFGAPLGVGILPFLAEGHSMAAKVIFAATLYHPIVLLPLALAMGIKQRKELANAPNK